MYQKNATFAIEMGFFRDMLFVVLLSAFAGTASLSAQPTHLDIVRQPEIFTANTPLLSNAAFAGVRPLSSDALFIPAELQWKPLDIKPLTTLDKSTRFRAVQLIAPLTLVAVSSFGLWDKEAKRVNLSIRKGFTEVRNGRYLRFDDYVQYVPAAVYFGLGFTGAKSRHNWKERLIVLGTSSLALGIMLNGLKFTVREPRPNYAPQRDAYPSGHTSIAFMGAELMRREYGLGYGLAAYTVACGIGVMRMYNGKHWLNDVIGGAGIGILSAQIGYWLLPYTRKLFGMGRTRSGSSMVVAPFYDSNTGAVGGGMAVSFN